MRVVVADDQVEVRSALRLVVEQQEGMTLVGEFAHVADLEARSTGLRPDLVLLDWDLDGLACSCLVARCRAACPTARVMVLGGGANTAAAALEAGADAFAGKHEPPEQLLMTLRRLGQEHERAAGGGASGARGYDHQKEDPCA